MRINTSYFFVVSISSIQKTIAHVYEDNNPFRLGTDVPHDVWNDYFDNHLSIAQDNTLINVQVVNVETYALRSDFWGYFGSLHKVPQRSVQTESTSTYYSGPTKIQIFFPKKEISQKQIL